MHNIPSILLLLIQRELASAANFAEYLHRSNVAFNYFDAVKSENIEAEQQRPGGGRENIPSVRRESISMSSLGGVNKITLLIEKTETDNNKIEHNVPFCITLLNKSLLYTTSDTLSRSSFTNCVGQISLKSDNPANPKL